MYCFSSLDSKITTSRLYFNLNFNLPATLRDVAKTSRLL